MTKDSICVVEEKSKYLDDYLAVSNTQDNFRWESIDLPTLETAKEIVKVLSDYINRKENNK